MPGTKLNASVEWAGGKSGLLHGQVTLVPKLFPFVTATEGSAAVQCETPPPAGFVFVGNGFCTVNGSTTARPQSYECSDSKCPLYTAATCGNICTATASCTGFMIEDETMYDRPNSCVIVSNEPPTGVTNPTQWSLSNVGAGTAITGHDNQPRDCCYTAGPPGPPGLPTPPGPPGPSPPSSYTDVGPGFCTGPNNQRPQTFICDTTEQKKGCPTTQPACAALCTADAACTGYMTQTMGSDPSTCNLVTSTKPSGSGTWNIQLAGKGLVITCHDQETRDHCYKKGGSHPQPPAPPPPPGSGDFVVVLQARFAWWRAGTVNASADGTSITLAPYGIDPFVLKGFGVAMCVGTACLVTSYKTID